MLIISEEKLRELIKKELYAEFLKQAKEMVRQLDPAKHYILVVPPEISEQDLDEAFSAFAGTNMVVLRADSVKLLEF